jgi:hypothetical protein
LKKNQDLRKNQEMKCNCIGMNQYCAVKI